jgi:hypothetical protein
MSLLCAVLKNLARLLVMRLDQSSGIRGRKIEALIGRREIDA